MYLVRNKHTGGLWSNEFGWTDVYAADRFSEADTKQLNLPLDGEWVTLWEVDCIQFARLIASADAEGVFDVPTLDLLSETTEFDVGDICAMVARAKEICDDNARNGRVVGALKPKGDR